MTDRAGDSATAARGGLSSAGFAVAPAFLTSAQVERARSLVAVHEQLPLDQSCVRPHNSLRPLRHDDALVDLVLGDAAAVSRVVADACANDLRFISAYISSKPAGSPPLWWHQDWWCWRHAASFAPAAPQVALLIYLSDTSERSGALRVLPGSHRHSTDLHTVLAAAQAQPDELSLDHPVFSEHRDQVVLEAGPGDAFLLDYRLLHGTYANEAGDRRDCLILNFAPDWQLLSADLRGHLISGFALPRPGEQATQAWAGSLLPQFTGERRDLDLCRDAPAVFERADLAIGPRTV